MKTILVPTDFSPTAENALTYAAEINKKINGRILLFHSYFIPVPATDILVALPSDAELRKTAIESLEKIKEKYLKYYPGMAFETEVMEGFPENKIIEMEKTAKCDLIVMGTRGASGFREVFMGSNTAVVITNSICPVFAVPDKAKMNGLKKIIFAANYGIDDFKNLFDVIDIARLYDSEVILLHINNESMDKSWEYSELEGFKQQIVRESKYQKISFKLLEDKNVYHGLNVYLEEIKADLLAINMRNRSFVQKIFTTSVTKKMVYHSHIPVLAYHTSIS